MKIENFEYNAQKRIIFDVIDELSDEGDISNNSFNQGGLYKEEFENIEQQIEILENELKKQKVDLFGFIKKYETEVFKDYDFTDRNGFVDCVLYKYDKNKGILSGIELIDSSEGEYFIKYSYGYHFYDMGKRFILQSFKNMMEYFNETAENLLIGLFSDEASNHVGNEVDVTIAQARKMRKKISIIKKYENGYIIYVNLFLFLNEIYKCNDKNHIEYNTFVDMLEKDLVEITYKKINNILLISIGEEFPKISKEEFDTIKEKLSTQESLDFEIKYIAHKYNL